MFIWSIAEPAKLDPRAQAALASPGNKVLVSAVSVWEIAIKQALGRLEFPLDRFDEIIERMGYDVLPVLPAHAIVAGRLPRHHADPFDRMLIGQAMVENFTLVSNAQIVARYDVAVLAKSTE